MGNMKKKQRGGYVGKILRVDLSRGRMTDEALPRESTLKDYLGCYGLGLRMLYDLLPSGVRPEDPENPLVFLTGPLTGLPLPSATNLTLTTLNFDTGFTVGRAHTHGTFGIQLKSAGYDGIIVTGRAKKPVYLWVHDGKAEIRDATGLWGKDSHETEDLVQGQLGEPQASVAAIGPAGENLCAGAMICNDRNHSMSHSGVGSAMGAKKLKCIAVSGEGEIPVIDGEKIEQLSKEFLSSMKYPGHAWTTLRGQSNKKGDYRRSLAHIGFCSKNFQINQFSEFGLGFGDQKFTFRPCPRCPVGCSYDLEVTTGPHKGYLATLGGGG